MFVFACSILDTLESSLIRCLKQQELEWHSGYQLKHHSRHVNKCKPQVCERQIVHYYGTLDNSAKGGTRTLNYTKHFNQKTGLLHY